jgi:membrane protein required for colicin V production
MNPFDAVVLGVALIGLVTGFSAGLLRSLATILAYVIAAPIALAIAPAIVNWLNTRALLPADKAPLLLSLVPFIALIVIAVLLGILMRAAVGSATGGRTVLIDRMLGALLGVTRIALLAVLLVLIFERIIPPGREPAWLKESQLRPYLSVAGAQGLQALPPEVTRYIDQLRRQHGL